jgi:RimJ/RimL family protein N-acetyltransferase
MAHPCWPFFDLRLRTARLELRAPTDEDLVELAALAGQGVHPPEVMPFLVPWSDLPSPALERGILQWHWRCRAGLGPRSWWLDLVVRREGVLVGTQGLGAEDFPLLRTVRTGSWLGRSHQGQGIGAEMRAAVLHLAFAGLGAEVATSAAFDDNPASERVSRKLGYEPNGVDRKAPRGVPVELRQFRLTRAVWAARPRAEVAIEGLAPCLPLLGAG